MQVHKRSTSIRQCILPKDVLNTLSGLLAIQEVKKLPKSIKRFVKEFLKDESGLTQTTETALLIAATIAAFFALVVNPVANALEFLWNLPDLTEEKFSDFIDWLSEHLSNLWGSESENVAEGNITAG
ncbi:MAG: hypothetical protein DRN90_02915 [Thermoproteota archaeon]|nr:MAG: hypothetical protein DRN90_02915 [Candidatus Korarchaeota archaeon]